VEIQLPNILSKKIELKEKGISTLRPRKVWFDDTVQRLNVDGRGELLGEFRPNDRLLIINQWKIENHYSRVDNSF
jgi:hypothetical protein